MSKCLIDAQGTCIPSQQKTQSKNKTQRFSTLQCQINIKKTGRLDRILQIKLGAQVMLTNNIDVTDGLFKRKNIISDETIVSFDVSALFTCIPVPVALQIINRKLTTHTTQEGRQSFLEHTHNVPKDKIIALLELVLNNCVFSFQHRFYKQLQGAVMGSSVS